MSEISPTDRELEALKVLWERGRATVRELADAINAGTRPGEAELAYTTVLSLLQVMEQKGLVAHERDGKAYVYLPRVERQSVFRRLAGAFLDKVFDGAMDEYLVHALEAKRLSNKELDQLESMLAKAREKAGETEAVETSVERNTRRKRRG